MSSNTFKIHVFSGLTKSAVMVFLCVILLSVSPAAVKLTDGSESSLKLSGCISEYPPTPLNIFGTETGAYEEWNVPRIMVCGEKEPMLFFFNGKNLYRFDYSLQKISQVFPNPVRGLWSVFPSRSEGIVYLSGNDFARFDMNSGTSVWKKNFGLTGVFYLTPQYRYRFPVIFQEVKDRDQLAVTGLQRLPDGLKYLNRLMLFNSLSGQLVNDRAFHFRRKLSGAVEIFVNRDRMEYEIINTDTLDTLVKGELDRDDLLKSSEYIAVERKRIGLGSNFMLAEFNAILLEKGFLLTSYENYDLWGGVKASRWSVYDESGKKVKSISPAPLTSVDYIIPNRGNRPWPVYMLHTLHKKMRRTRVDKIIALQKDGSVAGIEMPAIEGIKEFLLDPVAAWFHIGDDIYYLKYNGIYKFRIGDTTGKLLYMSDKSESCDSLYAWDQKYLMLTSSREDRHRDAVIIDTVSGEKLSPENYNERCGTPLWKMAVDYNQSGLPLPEEGLAPGFKKYMNYNCSLDMSAGRKSANRSKVWKSVRMLKVWNDYRPGGPYGDIGLVAASMKDKSSALIGINIADNRALFSVPVMEFSGLNHRDYMSVFPGRNYLPFNIIRLNETDALLVVLEKIGLLKIYLLKRP